MSACISRHGEFSEHDLDSDLNCTRCGAMDVAALIAERDRLAAALQQVREWASVNEIDEPPLDWAGLGDILAAALDAPPPT